MLTCRVLGATEVEAGRQRVPLGGPLPRRLITALIAADGRPVSERALADTIWGDEQPANPTISLQSYVSRLRSALGPFRDALERTADGYRVRAVTDAATFTAHVERGRLLLPSHPYEAARAFEAGLRLWRGTPFADLTAAPSIAPARARLEEFRAVAVEERLAARLAVADAPGAIPDLESAVRAEPYRERRWELLILGLYRSARPADALAALRRVRALLADNLGIDPGPALQHLEARLLAQDPQLLLPGRPARAAPPSRPAPPHQAGQPRATPPNRPSTPSERA